VRADTIESTIGNFNAAKLSNLKLPDHDFETQKDIADFLDRETARIDHAIERKQQLMELALEKFEAMQQAAISFGVDWSSIFYETERNNFRVAPDSCEVVRLKHLFRLLSGFAFKSEYFRRGEVGLPILITPGSFNPLGGIYAPRETDIHYSGPTEHRFTLEAGDLVVAMTDLSYRKLILGRCEFISEGNFLLNQRIAKIENLRHDVSPSFLRFAINAHSSREQVKLTAVGATVFHSSADKIRETQICLPSLGIQSEIAASLGKAEACTASLQEKISASLDQLREFRAALITAAVTGQIDVATWRKHGQPDRHLDRIEEALPA
jgi:type I restriction enzyme S subunit